MRTPTIVSSERLARQYLHGPMKLATMVLILRVYLQPISPHRKSDTQQQEIERRPTPVYETRVYDLSFAFETTVGPERTSLKCTNNHAYPALCPSKTTGYGKEALVRQRIKPKHGHYILVTYSHCLSCNVRCSEIVSLQIS